MRHVASSGVDDGSYQLDSHVTRQPWETWKRLRSSHGMWHSTQGIDWESWQST